MKKDTAAPKNADTKSPASTSDQKAGASDMKKDNAAPKKTLTLGLRPIRRQGLAAPNLRAIQRLVVANRQLPIPKARHHLPKNKARLRLPSSRKGWRKSGTYRQYFGGSGKYRAPFATIHFRHGLLKFTRNGADMISSWCAGNTSSFARAHMKSST